MYKALKHLCVSMMLAGAVSSSAQTGFVTVSGSHLVDSAGNPISNATISFAPVNAAGQSMSYQVNGGGQSISSRVSALSGTVTLTTGTGTAAGALLTITAPVAHQHLPDCQASVVTTAAPYTPLPVLPSYTISTWTINVGTAPAASTAYTITYTCPGS